MADELLRLYAERLEAQPGHPFPRGGRRLPCVRGHLSVRRDARSVQSHRRREQRPRRAFASDGPTRLRRRRVRQDRGWRSAAAFRAASERLQAGRALVPDHRPRAAAPAHVRGAHARLPLDHRRDEPGSRRRRSRTTPSRGSRKARSTSSSEPIASCRRTMPPSRTSGSSSSMRSSPLRRRPQRAG